MRGIMFNSASQLTVVDGANQYHGSLSDFATDSGLPLLTLPANIRLLQYDEADGRVLYRTEDSNQDEDKNYSKASLTLAINATAAALVARTARLAPTPQQVADATRFSVIDLAIGAAAYGSVQPATVAQLKAMDNAAFGVWFDANITTAAQAIGLLKLLTRIVIRRLL